MGRNPATGEADPDQGFEEGRVPRRQGIEGSDLIARFAGAIANRPSRRSNGNARWRTANAHFLLPDRWPLPAWFQTDVHRRIDRRLRRLAAAARLKASRLVWPAHKQMRCRSARMRRHRGRRLPIPMQRLDTSIVLTIETRDLRCMPRRIRMADRARPCSLRRNRNAPIYTHSMCKSTFARCSSISLAPTGFPTWSK